MKIALLQILPTGSLNGNREKGVEACRKAKVLGADIALFPEMWSNGYDIPEDAEALQRAAVPADGEFVSGFGELAAELNMAIAITFLEKTEKRPRNAVSLFDRHGRRLYTYAKVHTCDFGDECRLEAGEDEGIYLAELDMDMLREYRKREVHGNAYRRPEKYGILTETAIQEPFIRAERRRECYETVRYNEKV